MIPLMVHSQELLNVMLVDYCWMKEVLSFDLQNQWLNWMIVNLLTLVLQVFSLHPSVVVLLTKVSFPHLSVVVLMLISFPLSCPNEKKRTSSPTHPLFYQAFVPVYG